MKDFPLEILTPVRRVFQDRVASSAHGDRQGREDVLQNKQHEHVAPGEGHREDVQGVEAYDGFEPVRHEVEVDSQ